LAHRRAIQHEAAARRQQRLQELRTRLLDPHATALAGAGTDFETLWFERLAGITLAGVSQDGLSVVEVIARDGEEPADGRARATVPQQTSAAIVTACVDPSAGRGSRQPSCPPCQPGCRSGA
jgi:hypothetical protein